LGSECCVAAGDSGCEAYTAIAAQCVLCQSAFPSVPALAPAMYDLSWLNPTLLAHSLDERLVRSWWKLT
jgi:hypothetical protein